MEKKKRTTIAVMAAAVVLALIAGIFGCRAWADSRIEGLRIQAAVSIEDTKTANYEKEDRAQVKALIDQYVRAAEKAGSEAEIEAVLADFDKALEAIETAGAKLETAKTKAVEDVNGWNLSKYDKAGKAKLKKLMEKYTARIESAASAAEIKKLAKQFRAAAGKVLTKAEKAEKKRLEEEQKKLEEEQKKAEEEQNQSAPTKTASKSAAQQFVGGSAAAMAAAIGQPASKVYSQSCLGPGQDGVWYYNGFTVYTYKEGGSETVMSVE